MSTLDDAIAQLLAEAQPSALDPHEAAALDSDASTLPQVDAYADLAARIAAAPIDLFAFADPNAVPIDYHANPVSELVN